MNWRFIWCETVNYRTRRVTKSLRQNRFFVFLIQIFNSSSNFFSFSFSVCSRSRLFLWAWLSTSQSCSPIEAGGEILLLRWRYFMWFARLSWRERKKSGQKPQTQKSGRSVRLFFFSVKLLSMHLCIITNISRAKSTKNRIGEITLKFNYYFFLELISTPHTLVEAGLPSNHTLFSILSFFVF